MSYERKRPAHTGARAPQGGHQTDCCQPALPAAGSSLHGSDPLLAADPRVGSAHERTRTSTPFPALVPQTSLSTNSSTWASRPCGRDLVLLRWTPGRGPFTYQRDPRLGARIDSRRSAAPRAARANRVAAMLGRGLEPPRGYPHKILNLARLPIPPPERRPRHAGEAVELRGVEPLAS